MDFFDRQERARRTSRFLVVAFALSFAAVVAATTALAALILRLYAPRSGSLQMAGFGEWAASHIGLLGAIAVGTLALMTLASLYRAASLSGGGGQVARLLGGSEVRADTTDPARRRLMNVVEEMTIASGLPMPDVYVLEQEAGINAFAAGLTSSDAAIAVTRGAMERLDRAELQGVIGHEVSHILNGDMRLNQRLIGFAFGILVLSLIGRWLLRASRFGRFGRRGRSGGAAGAALALGVGFAVIGSIGLLLSRLIKAAVSRERERLADASAVQFTRDPGGLASALKKIGGYGGRLTAVETEEVAHMLFENHGRMFSGWFATHPPLVERIRTLEPSFDAKALAALQRAAAAQSARIGAGDGDDTAGAAGLASAAAPGAIGSTPGAPAPAGWSTSAPDPAGRSTSVPDPAGRSTSAPDPAGSSPLAHAGEVGSPALGAELRAALPPGVYDAAHSRDSSLLLVLALALAPDESVRTSQRALLQAQLGARRASRCEALRNDLERLDPALRIPLLELAMPALRQRPAEQLDYLFDVAGKLVDCGGERRLFDHLLLRMLAAQLGELSGRGLEIKPRKLSTRAACATLLAVVAAYGHDDSDAALGAYRAGRDRIGKLPEPGQDIAAFRDPARLDAALARLAGLGPRDKRKILDAALATIRHDKHIGLEELELVRAIGAALGCPLPWGAGLASAERPEATHSAAPPATLPDTAMAERTSLP